MRCASMVNSICSLVPGLEYSVPTLASAINFFNSGENAVVVALPTCLSPSVDRHGDARGLAGRGRRQSKLIELLFDLDPIHFQTYELPRHAFFVVPRQRRACR